MTEHTRRILLVDDDAVVQMIGKAVLQSAGFTVTSAVDGVDALERIDAGEAFDLVVTDLNMPRLNGDELLAELRQRTDQASLPVIILTGTDDEQQRASLIAAGARACIVKPINPASFLERVREVW